ncbi:serine protease inhibitor Kazal-type 2 isoform X1 [Myotis yumanensis]|uniref:serine protease inhibitor Kazal-type 2 isoform X1 n=1 Tax=Myotis yumanensis TaxID=159337 RepID=UPI0038D0AB9D
MALLAMSLGLVLLATHLAASLNNQFGHPSGYRTVSAPCAQQQDGGTDKEESKLWGEAEDSQTVINIDYQDVPETLTLYVEATCPLMPTSVLCA